MRRLTLFRRFLVVAALMFWQGGFTFYASVVVPLGQDVFGREQGFLTQRVTNYMNIAGAAALAILAWDGVAGAARQPRWQRFRWCAWLMMAAALVVLVLLHPRLDRLLDAERMRLLDSASFRPLHRLYLWISTIQWTAMLLYLLLTLQSWHETDRSRLSTLKSKAERATEPVHSSK